MDDPRAMEEYLRKHLDQAKARLQAAKTHSEAARQDAEHLPSADGSYAYQRALRFEGEVRNEFTRLLRLFNDLAIRGRLPSKEELPPPVCSDRRQLTNELRLITDYIVTLNRQTTGALLAGDLKGLQEFERQAQIARQRQNELLEQFISRRPRARGRRR